VPLSKPAIATVYLTLFISFWNAYYQAMMYMDNGYMVTIQLLLHRMMSNLEFLKQNSQNALAQQELSKLPGDSIRMAVCALTVLPTLLVFPRFQKYFIKGMAIGAVKE
ncbi:MAG: carbohydrate ABC transporter permease, partial [Roseburia sp.]|nr:carbohydrate ABC transporter permease [Roseburia sp.]